MPDNKLERIYDRDHHHCIYCNQWVICIRCVPHERQINVSEFYITFFDDSGIPITGAVATLDHIIPTSQGGLNEDCNYALACRRCNEKKAAQEFLYHAEQRLSNMQKRQSPKGILYWAKIVKKMKKKLGKDY